MTAYYFERLLYIQWSRVTSQDSNGSFLWGHAHNFRNYGTKSKGSVILGFIAICIHTVYHIVQESHMTVYTAHQKHWWLEIFWNTEYYSYTGRISRYFYSQIWNEDSIFCQPVKQMETTNNQTHTDMTENLASRFRVMYHSTVHCIVFSSVALLCPTLCDPMDTALWLSSIYSLPLLLVISSPAQIYCWVIVWKGIKDLTYAVDIDDTLKKVSVLETSLVVQRLSSMLPMQGAQVRLLIKELGSMWCN